MVEDIIAEQSEAEEWQGVDGDADENYDPIYARRAQVKSLHRV